jgi:hypothetical protein
MPVAVAVYWNVIVDDIGQIIWRLRVFPLIVPWKLSVAGLPILLRSKSFPLTTTVAWDFSPVEPVPPPTPVYWVTLWST